MPKVKIKFAPLWLNDDEITLSEGNTAELRDGFFLINQTTKERIWNRRPGLKKHLDLGTSKPVDGLYWWDAKACYVALSDGRLFKVSNNFGAFAELPGAALLKNRRPTFSTDGSTLLIANGTKIHATDGTIPTKQTVTMTIASPAVFTKANHGFTGKERLQLSTTGALPTGLAAYTDYYVEKIDANTFYLSATAGGARINTSGSQSGTHFYLKWAVSPLTDPDAPQTSTHVAWIDTYFLANNVGSDKFNYAKVGNNPDDWAALDFEVNMSSPDPTIAILVDNGEIACFGKSSVENYYDDGISPFSRNDAATMNHGCGAAYSAIKASGAWVWLNERREVVTPAGRTPQSLSEPIARLLQSFAEVSDAQADTFTISGQTFYVLSFPTEERTLVLNLTTGEWCGDWGLFRNGEYQRWLGNCYAYSPAWNQHLVGSRIDSSLFLMSPAYADDAGLEIRSLLRTGHIDHGYVSVRKKNVNLFLRFKVAHTDLNNPPQIMIRWRDDGRRTWGREVWKPVANAGESQSIVPLRGLGQYRTRQYEIVMTDPAPLVFMGAEEEIEVLS